MEAHPTLEYQKIKGDKTYYVDAPLVVEARGQLARLPSPKSGPVEGGIAPNQVIARSELEVHRQMFTE